MLDVSELSDLKKFAEELKGKLKASSLVLLSGPMGAGKTQLVKFLTAGEQAHSPTYSLINRYEGGTVDIYHIDLYRLEDEDDLESTGFWDLFAVADKIVIVEWADRLDPTLWPKNWNKTVIELCHEGDRRTLQVSSTKV